MTLNATSIASSADAAATPGVAAVPVVGAGEMLSMGVSMLLVVGAIVLLGWFYSRSKFVRTGGSEAINVVATRALGPKERLMIVEVADQQLLVGMTTGAVSTLHVFDKPLDVSTRPAPVKGFSERLRTAIKEVTK